MSTRQLLTCDGCGVEIQGGAGHNFVAYSIKLEDADRGPLGNRDGVKLELGPDFCTTQCFLKKVIRLAQAELPAEIAVPPGIVNATVICPICEPHRAATVYHRCEKHRKEAGIV